MEDEIKNRLLRQEIELGYLKDKLVSVEQKVTDMHELLLQAKGARWFVVGVATLVGFIIAKSASIAPWLTGAPK